MECPAPAPTGQGQPFQATVPRDSARSSGASRPRSPAPSCTVACAAAASGAHPPAARGLRLQPLRLAGLWRLLRLPRPGLRLGVHAGPCDVRALAPGVHGRDPERNEAVERAGEGLRWACRGEARRRQGGSGQGALVAGLQAPQAGEGHSGGAWGGGALRCSPITRSGAAPGDGRACGASRACRMMGPGPPAAFAGLG